MKPKTCPFLGIKNDPTTALDFPSEGNYCHHAQPVAPVKRSYQEEYCLTAEHSACPVYQSKSPVPLPPAIMETAIARSRFRRMLVIIGIPFLLAGAVAFILGWNVLGNRVLLPHFVPDTGQMTDNNYMGNDNRPIPTSGTAWELLLLSKPTIIATKENCPIPNGWVTYIVNPTDSLFRLSVIYGVSVEELQRVNCMGNSTTILPDQVIYVPFVPTKTPIPTKARATFGQQPTSGQPPIIRLPYTSTASSSDGKPAVPEPTNTSVLSRTPVPITATNVPVTATNTVVIPTSTSVVPTATFQPTPTFPPPTTTPRPSPTPKPTHVHKPTRTPEAPTPTTPPPTQAPTDTAPPPPTATNPPPPTSTSPPPEPTATALPPPTSTSPPPEPTSTSPPPP